MELRSQWLTANIALEMSVCLTLWGCAVDSAADATSADVDQGNEMAAKSAQATPGLRCVTHLRHRNQLGEPTGTVDCIEVRGLNRAQSVPQTRGREVLTFLDVQFRVRRAEGIGGEETVSCNAVFTATQGDGTDDWTPLLDSTLPFSRFGIEELTQQGDRQKHVFQSWILRNETTLPNLIDGPPFVAGAALVCPESHEDALSSGHASHAQCHLVAAHGRGPRQGDSTRRWPPGFTWLTPFQESNVSDSQCYSN